MNLSRGYRALWLGLLVALAAGLAYPASAQQPTLEERRLEYREALREYQAAVAAWEVLEDRWRQATEDLNRARTRGDMDELDRLEGLALQRSRDLQVGDRRVAETLEALDESRDALREAMDLRLEELSAEFDRAGSPAQRESVAALIGDLRNQFVRLEETAEEERSLARGVYPAINILPRDGPQDLRDKAALADRLAARLDTLIVDTDRRIERRREFLRIERLAGDARSSIDRFGDPRVPVTSGGAERTEGALVADSVGVVLDDLPPEEAIRTLEIYRQQLESTRDELRRRAAFFRSLIRAQGDE